MATDCDLMTTLCTVDADVVATSENHWRWLGRNRDGVVGHNCREWCHPGSWDLNWRLFRQSIEDDQPIEWVRKVVTSDGRIVSGRISVSPLTMSNGQRLVFCVNRIEAPPPDPSLARHRVSSLDCVDYIADITRELAQMSARCGLAGLSNSLEEVAGKAAMVSRRVRSTDNGIDWS